jgi:hypothetical protein
VPLGRLPSLPGDLEPMQGTEANHSRGMMRPPLRMSFGSLERETIGWPTKRGHPSPQNLPSDVPLMHHASLSNLFSSLFELSSAPLPPTHMRGGAATRRKLTASRKELLANISRTRLLGTILSVAPPPWRPDASAWRWSVGKAELLAMPQLFLLLSSGREARRGKMCGHKNGRSTTLTLPGVGDGPDRMPGGGDELERIG